MLESEIRYGIDGIKQSTFIHLCRNYVLSTCFVQYMVLGAGNTAVMKKGKASAYTELTP